jgi:hypothetical protein
MRTVRLTALVLACGVGALAGPAQAGQVNKSLFGGTAVKGYDVVAYHTEGRAVEGSRDYTVEWKDATWRFASAAHRDLFAADPEKYAPRYGGFCAYAVSQGTTADIDPEAWRIVDGRLYLNLSKDIQKRWEQDIPGYIAQADAHWPELSGEPAANPCNPCAGDNPCNPCGG